MVNYHREYALPLEMMFRRAFGCGEYVFGGLVRAGNFEHRPVSTCTMLLCKDIVGSHIDSPAFDKLQSFMVKYSDYMDKSMYDMKEDLIKELIQDVKEMIG